MFKTKHSVNQERYIQSLIVLVSSFFVLVLLFALLFLFLFVSINGMSHFMPLKTYTITSQSHSGQAQKHIASHLKLEQLQKMYQSTGKGAKEKLTQNAADNLIVVENTNLHVVKMKNGDTFVGELSHYQAGANAAKTRDEQEVLEARTAVDTLVSNKQNILNTQIYSLHQRARVDQLPKTQEQLQLEIEYARWQAHLKSISQQLDNYYLVMLNADGSEKKIPLEHLDLIYQPIQFNFWKKSLFVLNRLLVFISDTPTAGGQSGGIFPAIFGTFLMVVFMAILVTPFGAIVAIYLHEYAPKNRLTSTIRICISNMAAVPSVVYGVFGLGFFVYGLGGSIDELLFSDKAPAPTFGAPGLLWASLTMGLLTLPVVIVSTEEGLQRVPHNLRNGAYSLGATKLETITKIVLPIASPGILTGVILAIARAAGEVAPLMLVGAAKFAPNLPIDGQFPYIHFERQFMHLGVFIYDGALQNRGQYDNSSLMFASCMFLLAIVLILSVSATIFRSKLRERYQKI